MAYLRRHKILRCVSWCTWLLVFAWYVDLDEARACRTLSRYLAAGECPPRLAFPGDHPASQLSLEQLRTSGLISRKLLPITAVRSTRPSCAIALLSLKGRWHQRNTLCLPVSAARRAQQSPYRDSLTKQTGDSRRAFHNSSKKSRVTGGLLVVAGTVGVVGSCVWCY